jgi:hypothetical protein
LIGGQTKVKASVRELPLVNHFGEGKSSVGEHLTAMVGSDEERVFAPGDGNVVSQSALCTARQEQRRIAFYDHYRRRQNSERQAVVLTCKITKINEA